MPRSNRPSRSKPKQEPIEQLDLNLTRLGLRRSEIKRGVEYTVQMQKKISPGFARTATFK
jgi:hypothetical protein